jgi:hypothetical protein
MIGEHKMPSPSDVHWKEDPYSTIMDRYNFQKDGTTITVSKMGGYETYYFAVNYQELHTTPTEAKPYWQALHTRFEAEHEAWKADQKAKALAALAKVMG